MMYKVMRSIEMSQVKEEDWRFLFNIHIDEFKIYENVMNEMGAVIRYCICDKSEDMIALYAKGNIDKVDVLYNYNVIKLKKMLMGEKLRYYTGLFSIPLNKLEVALDMMISYKSRIKNIKLFEELRYKVLPTIAMMGKQDVIVIFTTDLNNMSVIRGITFRVFEQKRRECRNIIYYVSNNEMKYVGVSQGLIGNKNMVFHNMDIAEKDKVLYVLNARLGEVLTCTVVQENVCDVWANNEIIECIRDRGKEWIYALMIFADIVDSILKAKRVRGRLCTVSFHDIRVSNKILSIVNEEIKRAIRIRAIRPNGDRGIGIKLSDEDIEQMKFIAKDIKENIKSGGTPRYMRT